MRTNVRIQIRCTEGLNDVSLMRHYAPTVCQWPSIKANACLAISTKALLCLIIDGLSIVLWTTRLMLPSAVPLHPSSEKWRLPGWMCMVKSFIGSSAFQFNETLATVCSHRIAEYSNQFCLKVLNTALCHWKVLDPVTVCLCITQRLHYTFNQKNILHLDWTC